PDDWVERDGHAGVAVGPATGVDQPPGQTVDEAELVRTVLELHPGDVHPDESPVGGQSRAAGQLEVPARGRHVGLLVAAHTGELEAWRPLPATQRQQGPPTGVVEVGRRPL